MSKRVRQIIKIDEELCNGCGMCVPSCAEGALKIINGKAKVVSDKYCDGLGACLGECPQGALSIETREADDFDEEAAMANVAAVPSGPRMEAHNHSAHDPKHGGFVCPSAKMIDRRTEAHSDEPKESASVASELRQWPVKLYLVNPSAPYFQNADLLVAADCVPFAYGAIHPDFLRGKTLVTGCPKFDDVELYADKLKQIFKDNNIKSITILQMEVPCCSGIQRLVEFAILASGKDIPVESIKISLEGEVKSRINR